MTSCDTNLKYDGILTVTCYSPSDPDPEVKCELRVEDNGLLLSVGRNFLVHN